MDRRLIGVRNFMTFKTLFALLGGMLLAGGAAAQTPPATPAAPTPKVVPVPPPAAEPENILHLDLTSGGRVSIQLRPDAAPNHVERFKTLARRGFYDGLTFHRVIEGFMAQGGDPKGDGTGGSELPDVAAEFNTLPHVRGTVAAARALDVNSANSQFYIVLQPRFALDEQYTVFGRVIAGMNFVDAIEKGEPPANPTRIIKASVAADNVPPPNFGLAPPLPTQPVVTVPPGTPSAPR
jgi:cyclophilin family peptidyl-prolyl cis-trans isomerase